MNQEILQELKSWFVEYVATFKTGKADYDGDIVLKEDHTKRVCQEMLYIGENLDLTKSDLQLAEVMALFHDVGRFEQYARYGTFADRVSVNHAEFGVQILKEKQTLNNLGNEDQELIFRAIAYHNRQFLPKDESERCLYFSKLLRDADKLDIWKVFTDSYIDGANLSKAVIHGLQDTSGISDTLYNDLIRGNVANYADAKNLNDFKLLQTGWVYDVNFIPTFRRIQERGYLIATRNALPQSAQIDEIFKVTESYLKAHIQNVQ
ncbi:MAG: HD domain-containing protein [Chloroflexi bacterium]|nr:HD domain-containing protein [Chloroflexota bacterium]